MVGKQTENKRKETIFSVIEVHLLIILRKACLVYVKLLIISTFKDILAKCETKFC